MKKGVKISYNTSNTERLPAHRFLTYDHIKPTLDKKPVKIDYVAAIFAKVEKFESKARRKIKDNTTDPVQFCMAARTKP